MYRLPKVYFAGKIAKCDFRHQIVGDDIGLIEGDGRLFDPSYSVEKGNFRYNGPFFVRCDHGCAHGLSNHGVGATGEAGCLSTSNKLRIQSLKRRVFLVNNARIARADFIFCFIDSPDAFGTLVELGVATALNKRISVAFGLNLTDTQRRDLWYARQCANAGFYDAVRASFAWQMFEIDHLDDMPATRRAW